MAHSQHAFEAVILHGRNVLYRGASATPSAADPGRVLELRGGALSAPALERLATATTGAGEGLLLVAVNANGEIVADCVLGERLVRASLERQRRGRYAARAVAAMLRRETFLGERAPGDQWGV